MGGISERLSRASDPGMETCRRHVHQLISELGGQMVVAPGCSMPDDIDDVTVRTLRGLVPA
jgi:hypothetical protein